MRSPLWLTKQGLEALSRSAADDGAVTDVARLDAGGGTFGVDLDAGTWHGLVALEPGTVFFETKPGPYVAPVEGDLPAWAPPEGDAAAAAYETSLRGLFEPRTP